MIDNYENLPYTAFLRLVSACEGQTDLTDCTVRVLAILTGKTEDEILALPVPEYGRLTQTARFILTPPAPVGVKAEYKLGDMVLVPVLKAEKMTAGQFIDFQEYVKHEDKDIELLSCLLVPKGKKYLEDYEVADVQETLRKHLLTRDAIALKSFFLASSVASLPHILTSSEAVREKLTREQRRTIRKAARVMRSLKSGAGGLSLMQYRRLIDAVGKMQPE